MPAWGQRTRYRPSSVLGSGAGVNKSAILAVVLRPVELRLTRGCSPRLAREVGRRVFKYLARLPNRVISGLWTARR
jgi:hypothetical protein